MALSRLRDEVVDDDGEGEDEDRPASDRKPRPPPTDIESGVVAGSLAAEVETVEAATLELPEKMEWEAPKPPKEPSDPEAIRRYCGRTSVSGRESSSRSYASSTVF